MRKVYIPFYLIEWSDIRPYALAAGHGLKVGAHYAWVGLCYFGEWLGIVLLFLLKWLVLGSRMLARGMWRLLKAVWETVVGIFTVADPRAQNDEADDDDEPEPPASVAEEPKRGPRNLFDGED